MAMVINTNVASINSQRRLNDTSNALNTTMERLSSGMRINSAKDDAAGLAIADRMTSQIRGMGVAVRNANDGISLAQTAETAMGELSDTMQRMRDLSVQAANTGSVTPADRIMMNDEFVELQKELARVVTSTEFNGKKILAGSLSAGGTFQVGANTAADNQIKVSINNLSIGGAALITSVMVGGVSLLGSAASVALDVVDKLDLAISEIDTARAKLGATQNRFTSAISNLQSGIENQSAARGRIMDTDFAAETAQLSRNQILQQAGTAMLSQANQAPNAVMGLLR